LPGRCVGARKEIDTTASHNAGYFPDRNSTGRWIAGLAAAGAVWALAYQQLPAFADAIVGLLGLSCATSKRSSARSGPT